MCCIFGIGFLNGHQMKDPDAAIGITSALFKEAEAGGRAASGISIVREKTTGVLRRPMKSSDLVKTNEYLKFMEKYLTLGENQDGNDRIQSIIGHTRFPTKGKPSNNLNNHPQVINNVIGVHNGVISNDDVLFDKFNKAFSRLARVDTEIIFQLISHFSRDEDKTITAIQNTATLLQGSYACAVQNVNHPYNLYLFRSGNPIRVQIFKDLGIIVFATREYFIDVAMKLLDDVDQPKEIEIISENGLAINLFNRDYANFSIKSR
jgi:glucosamine 6-phosphate synthetase-like amidotransferase/phosphosugar isomerase protein